MFAEKSSLIVTGVARSGTTALGELFNAHPDICLGIERFKFQYLLAGNYTRDLFEKGRFFDFREEDTNLDPAKRPVWKPVYDEIARKWDTARIIGDKVPDLLPHLPDFMAQNPDFYYVCILRNLKDVALSWQKRADKPRDSWPRAKGFAAACQSWEDQYRGLHDMMGNRALRRKVLLLDYDTMYLKPAQTEAAILSFLGLTPDEGFAKTLHDHAAFFAAKRATKVPEAMQGVYRAVKQGYIRGLRKIASEQMVILSDAFAARDTVG